MIAAGTYTLLYAVPTPRPFVLGDRYVIRHPKAGDTGEMQVIGITRQWHPTGPRVAVELAPVAAS